MTIIKRSSSIIAIIAITGAVFTLPGCGGGGGGGSTPPVNGGNTSLTVTIQTPDLTGKTNQQVSIPLKVSGTGSVESARADIKFTDGAFEPVSGSVIIGGPSVELTGLPDDTACVYKWIDSRTIRVLYASADASVSGSVLANIPVKVKSESNTGLAIQNVTVNH